MAKVVRHFIEEARACSYLPSQHASLEYRLMVSVSPVELEALLTRGWRRFGPAYFRPACRACNACISIRLEVDAFEPSTSQRRALRRSHRFNCVLGKPQVDPSRLALHQAWHHTREEARGWEPSAISEDEYATQFAFPSTTGREIAWYDGARLVGLSLIDVTENCLSAAYFFYHPEIARLSPGVANVLRCLELARSLELSHLYLGYRVADCPSLQYKGLFEPHQLLQGRPAQTETPLWVTARR